MTTKDEIFTMIQQIMLDMFEIEPGQVALGSRLYEDLDFDSIDAVDMIVKLKEITGKAVQADDFKNARTVEDVVEAVFKLIND